ncbi:MAG: hypothetical protein WD359_03705 [Dehalococcoidia bacterium]
MRGAWPRDVARDAASVTLRTDGKLTRDDRDAVDEAVEAYGRFLGLSVEVSLAH